MGKIKLYQLKNIEKCPFKAYISQFKFNAIDNKVSMIRRIYYDILQDYDFTNLTEGELKIIITEKLDNTYFLTKQEKEIEVTTILNYLIRYIDYEKDLHRNIISKKVYGTIQIGNQEIELSADIVFENKDNIELVKYKTNSPELSYKARTEKNLPENNIELYLLKKLGEKLYSKYNKPIIASFYHLKGKKDEKDILEQFLEDKNILTSKVNVLKLLHSVDKKEQKAIDKQIKEIEDVLYFNNSIGNNIITYDYNKDLNGVIEELCNTKLNFNSEKCKSGDCDFCSYSTLCNYQKNDPIEIDEVKELKKANGKVKLTEAQKQVIDIEEGNYRINSVAGSGKTMTMALRTIELFKKGYKPNDILLITFTNKGCEELKEKITYWLNYYKIKNINKYDLNIFTFNSFGENIVSKEWRKLGFTKKPELATLIDVYDIIKDLLEGYDKIDWLNYKNPLLNYPNAKGAFKQLLTYFDLIKSFDYNINSLCSEVIAKEKDSSNLTVETMKDKAILIFEMYNKFNVKLKEKSLLQYQDQVLYLIELFEKYPEAIDKYGFKHIIVDEYQDTNFTQIKLLHLLQQYKDFKSLMVVGDSSQAIYSFINTTPENIINFDKEFDNVKDIYLLDNFRSTPQICNTANELDKLNTERIDKEIISKRQNGKLPQLIQYFTIKDEYEDITNLIANKIHTGTSKYEIAFIGRTKKELLELQKYLNERNIPNIIAASELYLDDTDVQCIVNLANFFKNNEYDYYLMEYMNIINDEFANIPVEDAKIFIEEFKTSIIKKINTIEDESSKINYFFDLITPITDTNIIAKTFVENLKTKTFNTFNAFLDYLCKINLYQDDTTIEKQDVKLDAVTLTTAHSSKGKEWSIVINSIDYYKYKDIVSDLKALEEERRLLFVSITRAKDELYITYNTNEGKARNKGQYSLFADELEGVEKLKIKYKE